MVSFKIFVKSMPPNLSESKVTPSFCFAFKIPDDRTASNTYHSIGANFWSRFTHFNIISVWKSILAHFIWPEKKIHIMKCFWHFPMKITKFSKVILAARLIRIIRLESKATWYIEMVFCYQNCSDLLWEKSVLVIKKNFWDSRLMAKDWQNFWDH